MPTHQNGVQVALMDSASLALFDRYLPLPTGFEFHHPFSLNAFASTRDCGVFIAISWMEFANADAIKMLPGKELLPQKGASDSLDAANIKTRHSGCTSHRSVSLASRPNFSQRDASRPRGCQHGRHLLQRRGPDSLSASARSRRSPLPSSIWINPPRIPGVAID